MDKKISHNIIENEWQKYLQIVAPSLQDGPETSAIKHAFLAGSISLFIAITEHIEQNEDNGIEFFNAISDEVNIILGPAEFIVAELTRTH